MPEETPFPTNITLGDFALNGSFPNRSDKPALITAHDGRSFTIAELKARVSHLATSLGDLLGWSPKAPIEPWDKVVALFAVNSVSIMSIEVDNPFRCQEIDTGLTVMFH